MEPFPGLKASTVFALLCFLGTAWHGGNLTVEMIRDICCSLQVVYPTAPKRAITCYQDCPELANGAHTAGIECVSTLKLHWLQASLPLRHALVAFLLSGGNPTCLA